MKKITLTLALFLFVAACGTSAEEQATMTATSFTATAAAWTKTPTITDTPTPTFTKTPTPTKTLDPSRYFSPDNTFSFAILEGWEETDVGLENPVLIGPIVGDINLNLVFVEEESNFPMAFYSALAQDYAVSSLQNLNQISEDFLLTDEGNDYFRWEITNVQQGITIHQILYFFESGDWKLVITYTRPNNSGAEYDEIIDEVMKTVIYKH